MATTTAMAHSKGGKLDDRTAASCTADDAASCERSAAINREGQVNYNGSSSFIEASGTPSTDFSIKSDTGSQQVGRGSSHFSTPRLSSSNRPPPPSDMLELRPTMVTETKRMRTARKLAEISQASLDFSRIGLIGRDNEKRVLNRLFQQILKKPSSEESASSLDKRAADHDQETGISGFHDTDNDADNGKPTDQHADTGGSTVRSLVSISGYSGTGKSALVATLRPKCRSNHVFFVSGKFDLKQMNEPYSGFRAAMIDLCSQICSLPRTKANGSVREGQDIRSFDEIKQHIIKGLNVDELQALHKLVPNLANVIGNDALCHADHHANDGGESTVVSAHQRAQVAQGFKEQSIQLKFAFRRFIKVICAYCPLVWVSDDVQWADKESLNMIESWVLDITISSLMVIICFRSNLVDMEGVRNGTISNGNVQGSDLDSVATSSEANTVGQILASIQKMQQERFIRYVDLEVNNLSLDNVHTMLKQLLGIYNDDDDGDGNDAERDSNRSDSSYGLAEIVFKKTDGNVFFVQQFIRMLVKDELLFYNIASMKWLWDNNRIKQETPASINVAELMELKLQQIDTAQYLLPLGACLGSTFSWSLLRTVLQGFVEDDAMDGVGHRALYESLFHGPPPASEEEWVDILNTYEAEGLIESHAGGSIADDGNGNGNGNGSSSTPQSTSPASPMTSPAQVSAASEYSFIHDKVQEAALGMIPSKMHLLELQHRIGIILMDRLSEEDFEASMFVVVNLLNARLDMVPQYPSSSSSSSSSSPSKEDIDITQTRRFRIAMLNFEAGTVAASHAAFRVAFQYFQSTIGMMPPDHWRTHYDMTLQLFTSAAECAYVSSKFEMMQKYGNMVIERDECPLIDKIRAYHVLMDGKMVTIQQGKARDRMAVGAGLMAQLGFPYPKGSKRRLMVVIMRLLKLKASTRKWTLEYLESMKPSEDPMDELIIRSMDKYGWSAALCDPGLHPLITIDGVNYGMKKGRTNSTPVVLASLAMLVGPVLDDWEKARLYADYAIRWCKEGSDKSVAARAMVVSYGLAFNNFIPYENCMQPVLDAHPDSMSAGDMQIATWAVLFYFDLCFLAAKSLKDLDTDLSTYTKVSEDFNQAKATEQLSARWQMVLNLRGRSDGQTMLVGDVFDEIASMRRHEETKDGALITDLLRNKVFLMTYFGDYDNTAQMVLKIYEDQMKTPRGYSTTMFFIFATSFTMTIASNQDRCLTRSQRSTYKRLAQKTRKQLRGTVNKGNPNAVHCLAILNAERAAWKAHKSRQREKAFMDAVTMYQDAIRACARTGFPHNQALANERLAEHMLLEQDVDSAEYHLNEAIRLYDEWGASKKVSLLQEHRKEICDRSRPE